MILLNLFFMILLFSVFLPAIFNDIDYSVYLSPIYESETEIYFELDEHDYDSDYGDTSYIAVYNKLSGEFSISEDLEYAYIQNYITSQSMSYAGEYNSPIFFNYSTNQYTDIRDNQVVEVSDECSNISKSNDTCNILDNDIQIVVNDKGSDIFEVVLSDYVLNTNLTSYSFTEYTTERNLYTSISSYNKYDENKVGIKIDFYTINPDETFYYEHYYLESIILEYTIDSNSLTELFKGPEYKSFNFTKNDNCYIFNDYDNIYKYDITSSTITSIENEQRVEYIGNGYWYGYSNNYYTTMVFKYDSDLNTDVITTYTPTWYTPYAFSNNLLFDVEYHSSSRDSYITHRLVDLNTGDILLEIDSNSREFMDNIT